MLEVWWSSLLAADRDLLRVLDDTERARVRSHAAPADQGRSMIAAAMLRAAVGERLGLAPHDVVIDRTCEECGEQHGRPVVVGPAGVPPRASVSHSGLLVVVALADGPVGVDVQRIAELDAPDGAWDWVRREAVLKVGDVVGPVVVRPLAAPRDGYAAALALAARDGADDAAVKVRSWPPA